MVKLKMLKTLKINKYIMIRSFFLNMSQVHPTTTDEPIPAATVWEDLTTSTTLGNSCFSIHPDEIILDILLVLI